MPNRFASVRAVLLDAVGTVIHPEPSVAVAYRAVGRAFGSTLEVDVIAARFRRALAEQYRTRLAGQNTGPSGQNTGPLGQNPGPLGQNAGPSGGGLAMTTSEAGERQRWRSIVADVLTDIDEHDAAFEMLWDHFGQGRHWILYDDVRPTWNELERRGWMLGIASNFDSRLLGVCAAHEPLHRASHIFYSSQIGYPKPSLRFFRAIEQALELRPHQLLLVGDDRENDLEGARAAGWHALLLNRAEEGASTTPSGMPHASLAADEIRSLRELLELLQPPSL